MESVGSCQAAIWDILNPGKVDGGAGEEYWKTKANEGDASDEFENFDFKYYHIITDEAGVGKLRGGKQEFLTYATPEPGTWLLMGSGLLILMVGVGPRRLSV